jgi:hypothetical protein
MLYHQGLGRQAVISKLGAVALLLAGAWQASAATLQPYIDPPVAVSGAPGDTVGWGFTIYNPTIFWISFTGSSWTQSTPSDGTYYDFIGQEAGPGSDFAIAPAGTSPTTWQQTFDSLGGTGIGQFIIDPGVPVPGTDSGRVEIDYALYNGSPGNDPLATQVGSGVLTLDGMDPNPDIATGTNMPVLTANFQNSAVPEPSTALPLGLLALGWTGVKFRRRFAK